MENPFLNRRVAVRGKLGSMTLQQASSLVRKLGGKWVALADAPEVILLGADSLPDETIVSRETMAIGSQLLTEAELWQRLGWLDHSFRAENASSRRLHSPAMLAEIVDVPVPAIRRWFRAGLLLAEVTIHRLPYFDFAEIAVAKQIATLVSGGLSLAELQRKLATFTDQFPDVKRPLAELTFIVDGKRWLVRRNDQLLDAKGQQQFDFEACDDDSLATLSLRPHLPNDLPPTPAQLLAQAEECDSAGETALAVEYYRAVLVSGGANAEVCFQLADCLYRLGDLTAARERYAQAIELDPEHVEARANLGCVLTELGENELAIAALQGAIELHPDYADAHLHLAKIFDALHQPAKSEPHWQRFASLSLGDPWEALADHRQ